MNDNMVEIIETVADINNRRIKNAMPPAIAVFNPFIDTSYIGYKTYLDRGELKLRGITAEQLYRSPSRSLSQDMQQIINRRAKPSQQPDLRTTCKEGMGV